ncbi:MAG: hypothetical protein RL427_1268 [Bacteroidota bacterium]|jgi:uncharacterized protein YdeI (YjbR/CyaY-like superfamily)
MAEKHVWDKVNQWAEELSLLRAILQKTELIATKKWGGEIYTLNNKNVVGIGGFKSYFGLWFMNGVFLKDEAKVLVNANEGNTRGLRQWRFTSVEAINEKLLMEYLLEAIANEKAGLSIKPMKKEALHCAFFAGQLAHDAALSMAFEQFKPYKQKEFWEYMATAKQEKTKITRFAKIKALILEQRGLNDKYTT